MWEKINIDIDENSLLNPSIITKFKIKEKKLDVCFDLDSFALKLEENENNKYDYVDYLRYIFQILISFKSEECKIKLNDENLITIPKIELSKLKFKNFDFTRMEYILGENITFIEEEEQIFDVEEKERERKFDDFDREIRNFECNSLINAEKLVFDNCTNYFIELIFKFTNRKKKKFDLIKVKKCVKDYVNFEKILSFNITELIVFDTPMTIGNDFSKKIENIELKVIDSLKIVI